MNRLYLMLCVLLAVGVTAQANLVVNGDFAMYVPGTTIRSTAVTTDIWVQQVGLNRPISGGTVTFEDLSTRTKGELVDIPGWITPLDMGTGMTNNADLFSEGYVADDGTSCLNAFGAWSGNKGGLAKSADPIVVQSGTTYTLSAMLNGNPAPYIVGLLLDGVLLTPDASTDPAETGWREVTRTYNSIGAGDLRVLLGTPRPGEGEPALTGSRLKIDNVTLVPEPATMLLLGLGGLGLVRRKR